MKEHLIPPGTEKTTRWYDIRTNQLYNIAVHVLRMSKWTEVDWLSSRLIPAQGCVMLKAITGAILVGGEVRHKLGVVFWPHGSSYLHTGR